MLLASTLTTHMHDKVQLFVRLTVPPYHFVLTQLQKMLMDLQLS